MDGHAAVHYAETLVRARGALSNIDYVRDNLVECTGEMK